jgi:hypothetical protein
LSPKTLIYAHEPLENQGFRPVNGYLHQELTMATPPLPATANETREERIEAIMKELRPKIEATVRKMVERAVDVAEAEEFGAIDFEFRDAGQELANDVRQASVASRKKRGT